MWSRSSPSRICAPRPSTAPSRPASRSRSSTVRRTACRSRTTRSTPWSRRWCCARSRTRPSHWPRPSGYYDRAANSGSTNTSQPSRTPGWTGSNGSRTPPSGPGSAAAATSTATPRPPSPPPVSPSPTWTASPSAPTPPPPHPRPRSPPRWRTEGRVVVTPVAAGRSDRRLQTTTHTSHQPTTTRPSVHRPRLLSAELPTAEKLGCARSAGQG